MELNVRTFEVGERINGIVISVEKEAVFFDIGASCDAKLDKAHFSYEPVTDLRTVVHVGDELATMIAYVSDEQILLSRLPFEKDEQFAEMLKQMDAEEILTLSFEKFNRGGLEHKTMFTYFMPASQIGIKGAEPKDYVNQPFEVMIIDVNQERKQFIVSARKVKEMKFQARKAEALATLAVDKVITAKVTHIVEAGIEVRYDDVIRGFVPRKELTHLRFEHVADLHQIGETVELKVVEMRQDGQFIASMKALQPTPWEQFIASYRVGDIVEGVVKNITTIGAFVSIIPGVQGLLHKSEVSYDNFVDYRAILSENEQIKVKIINIDEQAERLSLSIKQLEQDPWETLWERYHEGDIINVTVKRIESKHLWVHVEQYVDALLYRREALLKEHQELSDVYKEGDVLEAKITELNPKRRRLVVSAAAIVRDAEAEQLAEYRDKIQTEITEEKGALKGKFANIIEPLAESDDDKIVSEEVKKTK